MTSGTNERGFTTRDDSQDIITNTFRSDGAAVRSTMDTTETTDTTDTTDTRGQEQDKEEEEKPSNFSGDQTIRPTSFMQGPRTSGAISSSPEEEQQFPGVAQPENNQQNGDISSGGRKKDEGQTEDDEQESTLLPPLDNVNNNVLNNNVNNNNVNNSVNNNKPKTSPSPVGTAFAQRRARKLQEFQTTCTESVGSIHSSLISPPSNPQRNEAQQVGNVGTGGEEDGKTLPATFAQLPDPGVQRRRRTPCTKFLSSNLMATREQHETSHSSRMSTLSYEQRIQKRDRDSRDSCPVDSDILLMPDLDGSSVDLAIDAMANDAIRRRESSSSIERVPAIGGLTNASLYEEEFSVPSFGLSYVPPRTLPMDEFNIPRDQPGAFAARGRAFGEHPTWGRGDSNRFPEEPRRRLSAVGGWIQRSLTTITSTRPLNDDAGTVRTMDAEYSTSHSEVLEADLVDDVEQDIVRVSGVIFEDSSKLLRRRYIIIFVFLGVIIIGLVLGLSLMMSHNNGDLDGNSGSSDQGYQGDLRCILTDDEKDVFGHCVCYNTTDAFVLSEAEEEQYILMQQLLFDENITSELYPRSSCDSFNEAILCMANYERIGLLPTEVALAQPWSIIQRFVLIYMYITMNGENWTNDQGWLQEKYICDWSGLTCSFLERISEIDLSSQGLEGILPTQLGRMPFLRVLDLSHNPGIYGFVPHELTSNPSLHEIDVSNNQLTGIIPVPLLNSTVFLDRLILSNNSFTGTIPSAIGRFPKMRQLSFDNNRIHGSIPEEIGLLVNLEVLELDSNQMTGTIPHSLQSLVFLEQIALASNSFSGTIPSFIGSAFPNLETLFVYGNQYTGTIPESFCDDGTGRRDFSKIVATCTGNYSVVSSCSCCADLVYCFELLPPALQDSL